MQRPRVRAEFAASLRSELEALPAHRRGRRLWLVPGRAWAALAAVMVVGLAASGAAIFMVRPEPASAAAKVSAAITQVEGPHLFYFAVPGLTGR